jgi:hypothetical protein
MFLSAVTIGEIAKGVAMKALTDPGTAAVLGRWLDELRLVYAPASCP